MTNMFTRRPATHPYRTLFLRLVQLACCIGGAMRFGPGSWGGIGCAFAGLFAVKLTLEAVGDVMDERYAVELKRSDEARRKSRPSG